MRRTNYLIYRRLSCTLSSALSEVFLEEGYETIGEAADRIISIIGHQRAVVRRHFGAEVATILPSELSILTRIRKPK